MSDRDAENLRKSLEDIFADFDLVPGDVIAAVHSFGFIEDGRSFLLMLDMVCGSTMTVAAAPGEPLRVYLLKGCAR